MVSVWVSVWSVSRNAAKGLELLTYPASVAVIDSTRSYLWVSHFDVENWVGGQKQTHKLFYRKWEKGRCAFSLGNLRCSCLCLSGVQYSPFLGLIFQWVSCIRWYISVLICCLFGMMLTATVSYSRKQKKNTRRCVSWDCMCPYVVGCWDDGHNLGMSESVFNKWGKDFVMEDLDLENSYKFVLSTRAYSRPLIY